MGQTVLARRSLQSRAIVALTASIAALGGLLFGYNISVISGAMPYLRRDFHLSDTQVEFAVGILLAGALAGSAVAGYAADRWGRRTVLLWTALGFTAFAALTGLSSGIRSLAASRFLLGCCIGIVSLLSPLYLAEVSPTRHRGALVSCNQLAITAGILLAYLVDYVFAASGNWRGMFVSAIVPAVGLMAGMFFLPETPRWLARQGCRQRALESLQRLGRGDEADAELNEVEGALQKKQERIGMLFQRGFRRAVLIGVSLAIIQSISGIDTIIFYAPEVLTRSGYSSTRAAIMATVMIGIVNVAVTVLSMLLIDRMGRRFLLLLSSAGMAVMLGFVGLAFHRHSTGLTVFYELVAAVVFFGVGLGPVMWLLISEIYPTKIRGKAMSLATLSNWGADWLITGTFLSLVHWAGPAGTFWIYGVICAAAFAFSYAMVPETKGKSLEAIERYWSKLDE